MEVSKDDTALRRLFFLVAMLIFARMSMVKRV